MKSKLFSLILALSLSIALVMSMTVTASAYVQNDINAQATTEVIVEGNATAEIVEDSTPLTPDGNGNMVDDSTSKNKEFITVQTKNGNYFYLILDKDRDSDNAYLLSQIDEADLAEFIEQDEKEEQETPVLSMPVVEEPTETPEPQEEKPASHASNSNAVTLLLLAVAGGGVAYYFKVYKPKHSKPHQPDNLESMEFEDEPEINEDDSRYSDATTYGKPFVEDDFSEE